MGMMSDHPRLTLAFDHSLHGVVVSVHGTPIGLIKSLDLSLQPDKAQGKISAYVWRGPDGDKKKGMLLELLKVEGLSVEITEYDEAAFHPPYSIFIAVDPRTDTMELAKSIGKNLEDAKKGESDGPGTQG